MSITHSSILPVSLDEAFAWHERPGAIVRLTPPWVPATIRQEAASLADGTAILSLGGLEWVARHNPAGYQPPHRFVDELVADGAASLPAAAVMRWRHTHELEAHGASSARLTDRIDTWLGSRILRPMLAYRHRQLAEDLAAHAAAPRERLTIAVTGASGLVGSALTAFLTSGGHRVVRLERHAPSGPDARRWDPQAPAADLLDGIDAVVHLAGASIAGRFTDAHKREVRDSRIEPTRLLAQLAARAHSVQVFVSASAIGVYGADRGDETLTEQSDGGDGFLADLVRDWEAAAADGASGMRAVQVRTGIVQSPRGGTLRLMRPLFAAGAGGPIAGGQQWLSWIDIDDLVDVYHRAIVDARLEGAVNATAPTPVRGVEYATTLARVMHRPALLPVPALGPRLILGDEGSRELAEADQRVLPTALQSLGHEFRRADLEDSLRHQLGRPAPTR